MQFVFRPAHHLSGAARLRRCHSARRFAWRVLGRHHHCDLPDGVHPFRTLGPQDNSADDQGRRRPNPLRSALPPVCALTHFLQRRRSRWPAHRNRAGHRTRRCNEQCHRLAHAAIVPRSVWPFCSADLAELENVPGDHAGRSLAFWGEPHTGKKVEGRVPHISGVPSRPSAKACSSSPSRSI